MDGSYDWQKFGLIDNENSFTETTRYRRCPRCGAVVTGRPNKIYCPANCRKRHREIKRNSVLSMAKRRENTGLYDRAIRLTEMLYSIPPHERLGFMKDLIDRARLGGDAQLRDILSNQTLSIIFVCTTISVLFGVPVGIAMSKSDRLKKASFRF